MKSYLIRNIRWFVVSGMAATAAVILLLNVAPSAAQTSGRILTDAEMAAIFGDAAGTDPCVSTYDCSQGFTEGTNCVQCVIVMKKRKVCCNIGSGTQCNAGGGALACGSNKRYVGTINGTVGTCTTCALTNPTPDGICAVNDATGGLCPVPLP